MNDLDRLLTAKDVVSVAGITYRQLDHWCREKRLTPFIGALRSGVPRRFRFEDVVVAATLGHWQRTFHSIPMELPEGFEARVREHLQRGDTRLFSVSQPPIYSAIDLNKIAEDCRTRLSQADSCPADTACATMDGAATGRV